MTPQSATAAAAFISQQRPAGSRSCCSATDLASIAISSALNAEPQIQTQTYYDPLASLNAQLKRAEPDVMRLGAVNSTS